MALNAIGDQLWCLDSELRLAPGFWFPVRMTVAKLADGSVWLHSPISIDDATASEIDAMGPVTHIVAPSLLHHLFVAAAKQRWPAATFHAPASLSRKRADLRIERELSEDERWPEIEIIAIAGAPKIDEFVFVHRPSKSLIVTDAVFNIHAARGMTPLILRMVGAWKRLAQSRMWRSSVKDRGAFRASGERVLGHAFERIIPAHGDVVTGPDTPERLRAALSWMLA